MPAPLRPMISSASRFTARLNDLGANTRACIKKKKKKKKTEEEEEKKKNERKKKERKMNE